MDKLLAKFSQEIGNLKVNLFVTEMELENAKNRIAELEAQLGQQNQPEENTEIIEGE